MFRTKLNFDDVKSRLGILSTRLGDAMRLSVAEWLRLTIRDSFNSEASPEGVPWKPLSVSYLGWKVKRSKRTKILQLTSELSRITSSRSDGVTIRGNSVIAFSVLPYAAAHQYGASGQESVRSFIRQIRSGKTAARVGVRAFTRKRNTPARPFLPTPEFAEREAAKVMEQTAQDAIEKAGLGE